MTSIAIYYTHIESISRELSHQLRIRVASDYTGESPDVFTDGFGLHGKPYFKSHPDVHFSVSHSDGVWICAFADSEIGCDVQEYRTDDTPSRLDKIARRWFSAAEYRYFTGQGSGADEFCRIWSRKEAYVKYTGNGIGDGFRQFSSLETIGKCRIYDFVLPSAESYAAALAGEFDAEPQKNLIKF